MASLSVAAMAVPDLIVADLFIDPAAPYAGTAVHLEAVVENVGSDKADGQIFVRFEIDGQLLEDAVLTSGVGAGERRSIFAVWDAEEGTHLFTAEVDRPFDRVHEWDETNNLLGLEMEIPRPSDVYELTRGATVAVASFFDSSASGLIDVGGGISDKITQQLAEAGVRTLSRIELEETLRMSGLNPFSIEDTVDAARMTGADFVLRGDVTGLELSESSISLGALSIGTARAEVRIEASLLETTSGQEVGLVSAHGDHETTAEFSLDLAGLLNLPDGLDTCAGGLRTDRDAYRAGESVRIGFRNPAPDTWYSVEILSSSGAFLQWLGWQFVPMGECGVWVWDQRDTFNTQVSPSVYVARISDAGSQVGSVTFEVRPGASLFPLADDLTVGTPSFDGSVAGKATRRAVDRLVTDLIPLLAGLSPSSSAMMLGASEGEDSFESGRIAAILPDGRVAINIGASSGVSRGDFFLVLDETEWAVRGEIVVVEVRDSVSYAVRSTDFEPRIGDLVRPTVD